MHNHPSNIPKPQRRFEVDMSSEAIASRIREVGELYELGVSLAKAKPCPKPDQPNGKQSNPE